MILDPLRLLAGTLLFIGVYYLGFYNGRRYERDHGERDAQRGGKGGPDV